MTSIRITGHSGYTIALNKNADTIVLRKEAAADQDDTRLQTQFDKQTQYSPILRVLHIGVPKMLTIYPGGGTMEYISNALTMIEFFERSGYVGVDWFFNQLKDVIHHFVQLSKPQDVYQSFVVKLSLTLSKIEADDSFKHRVQAYFDDKLKQPMIIPVGVCHGDLTLSNILVSDLKLYFVDFLDSFIEGPIQDMVKIRQDTQYDWTLQLCNFNFDRNKLRIILRKLDSNLHKHFSQTYPFYNTYYDAFQIMNLLRILPYCSDKSESCAKCNFLKKSIIDLIVK